VDTTETGPITPSGTSSGEADDNLVGAAADRGDAHELVTLPLLPVSTGVVFPGMVVTFRAESDDARTAVDAAERGDHDLLLVPRIAGAASADGSEPGSGRYATVGTVVRIEQTGTLPDGARVAIVRGRHRARLGQGVVGETTTLWVEAHPIIEPSESSDSMSDARVEALAGEYREVARELLEAVGGRAVTGVLAEARSPGALADTIGWWPSLPFERKVELLETLDVETRLTKALSWARAALAETKVAQDIDAEVTGGFEKAQREMILRRQMDAIRKELGDGGDDAVADYRTRVAESGAPDTVATAINKEIDRLERVGEQSMESSWIRTWLDTILEVPWGSRTEDDLDLVHARSVLDADHTGLDEVKDRIIEFLAVRKRRAERNVDTSAHRRAGTILVLAGPPGVGKTSLGESVARALGRTFVRTALGGIHDEAEIRGHRRTYVGARPGRIVRALIDADSMNPVILLDEIDKVGSDYRGDPTAALLEVLDPAQNHTFRDHYLEVELDLSGVVFIATANALDRVPAPLLDRMEVITISGYSEDEKLAIARDHLVPRVFDRNGVDTSEVELTDDTLRAVISGYTREAGVRRLEQRLDRLVRKAATRLATGEAVAPVQVDPDSLRDVLGRPIPDERPAERVIKPGIATGLAVTGAGGDVLYVEAVDMDGEPGLTLTGQLGDVMRESGEIALSYLRANAATLGIDATRVQRRFHVHFPAGAVPKDGPSAGITMTTALASQLTGRAVRSDVAMTGEITLQGRVLPIGGVKEKVLAAHRAGIRTVILPKANEPDAEDIPDEVREELTLHFVDDISDVLRLALVA
jgi:ATP-dependent Lon protease